jgi:hypothetical protein
LTALEFLEDKVKLVLENDMFKYDPKIFDATFEIIDSSMKEFKNSPEVKRFKEGLFDEEEAEHQV